MNFKINKSSVLLFMLFSCLSINQLFSQTSCTTNYTDDMGGGSGTEIFMYDATGRISQAGSAIFNYNSEGRLISVDLTSSAITITITDWDSNGYPITATSSMGAIFLTVSNIGQLISRTIGGGTDIFTYDPITNNLLSESDGARTRTYSGTFCRGIFFGSPPGGVSSSSSDTTIPTLSQWGLLVFGLLIMNLSIFFVQRRDLV